MKTHNSNGGAKMSKEQIKAQIEMAAHETQAPVARIITAMQGELARMGDEDGLQTLIEIKREYAP
jgi:hypothetical protein